MLHFLSQLVFYSNTDAIQSNDVEQGSLNSNIGTSAPYPILIPDTAPNPLAIPHTQPPRASALVPSLLGPMGYHFNNIGSDVSVLDFSPWISLFIVHTPVQPRQYGRSILLRLEQRPRGCSQ